MNTRIERELNREDMIQTAKKLVSFIFGYLKKMSKRSQNWKRKKSRNY